MRITKCMEKPTVFCRYCPFSQLIWK